MRVNSILRDSSVDGEGLRTVVFFQGCSINCPGCHNNNLQTKSGGIEFTPQELFERLGDCPEITLSGGEPLEQPLDELFEFIKLIKNNDKNANIWIYSGRKLSLETTSKDKLEILKKCDILVDGPFRIDMKKPRLLFRGSSNQRIIDLKKTFKSGKIVISKKFR